MTSLNEYNENIRKEIGLEFGFEAIGFGAKKLNELNARDYLKKWEALSVDEQNALLKKRGF